MATVLEQAISIGEESSWGRRVAPTRSYEATGDDWTRQVRVNAGGFVRSQQAALTTADRPVTVGAQGSINCAVLDNGMGLLFKHMLGSFAQPIPRGDLYRKVFKSDTNGPGGSYTVTVYRVYGSAGHGSRFWNRGCIPTGWTFDVAAGGPLNVTVSYDAAGVEIGPGSVAPAYADGDPFTWADCQVSIAGVVDQSFTQFTAAGRLGMRTATEATMGATKTRPRREAQADYMGSLTGIPDDLREYVRYELPDPFPIQLSASKLVGGSIRSVTLLFHACRYMDSRLRSHVNRPTGLSLPFKAFQPPGGDVVTLTVVDADSGW